MVTGWIRWGLRGAADFLNYLAGPTTLAEEEGKEIEELDEEEEFWGSGLPLEAVIPELRYVVAGKEEQVDASRFWDADILKYSLENLPSKEQVMEDIKKKTGLTNCEFYSCSALSGPSDEFPFFERGWTPSYYNLVKVVPL